MLTMAAPQIGLAEGVTFSVPLVPGRSENAAGQRPERIPSEADLTILSPQPPLEVFPGETVAVRLKTSRELPRPSKILVIAPFYLFEDMYSSLNYRLRIPKDYPPGELTVVLLAYWDRDGAEEGIVSKTLMFRVKAIPVCPPDCQDQDSLRADVMQK
ncbi:MAG: hypothetical protein U1D99_06460 [Candidatus Omnitrophota bacterium]|nr:hypothetical protein [Candidatus Omnitrophota bacterium]